jgi:hypothetical protein
LELSIWDLAFPDNGYRLQTGSGGIWRVCLAGRDPALGLLFRKGLELIRVSFPKNPRKQ